jgi:hypothetical protein
MLIFNDIGRADIQKRKNIYTKVDKQDNVLCVQEKKQNST